jgi:hypothetical protein
MYSFHGTQSFMLNWQSHFCRELRYTAYMYVSGDLSRSPVRTTALGLRQAEEASHILLTWNLQDFYRHLIT